jgi:hypothetical protein
MRRLSFCLPLVFLLGCSSTPSPAPSVQASPVFSVGPSPSAVSIVCGPLASAPSDCTSAVEAAFRLKDPGAGWSSIRIDAPATSCADTRYLCGPTVIVRFLGTRGSFGTEVPLIRGTAGWLYFSSIQ